MPKIVQIDMGTLKIWAFECSGLAWTKHCRSVPKITQIGSDVL